MVLQYIKSNNIKLTVSEEVKKITMNPIKNFLEKQVGNSVIAGGDFNGSWKLDGKNHAHNNLAHWVNCSYLTAGLDAITDDRFFTYKKGLFSSTIDHIFTSKNCILTKGETNHSSAILFYEDHTILWGSYKLEDVPIRKTPVTIRVSKKVRRVELLTRDIVLMYPGELATKAAESN